MSAGLSSGFPFYDSEEIKETNEILNPGKRILIGTLEAINFNMAEEVTLFFGLDFFLF